VFLGRGFPSQSEYSEEVATQIDHLIRDLAFDCYEKARKLVRENRMLIDQLVELLLEIETLEGEQFRKLVAEHNPSAVKVS